MQIGSAVLGLFHVYGQKLGMARRAHGNQIMISERMYTIAAGCIHSTCE
jgi:hypothetical protein